MDDLTPVTRTERLLDGEDLTPTNREEMFIKRIYDKTQEIPEPVNRKEYFLKKAGEAGGDVTVVPLSVTDNGTYTAPSGKAYTPVTVEVEPPANSYQLKSITTPTSLATFEASEMPMPTLKVSVEAQQDLHGYDKPWVGGAGKNKLPMTVDGIKAANTSGTWNGNAYTANGVTFTIMTDNSGNVVGINVNGTCTSDIYLFLYGSLQNVLISGTSYKLNGCPPNGSNTTYGIGLIDPVTFGAYWDYGEGVTFTYPSNVKSARILIRGGASINNLVFTPMIRLATETDATFAPYSNICPISGWDEANVSDVDDVDNPTVTQTTTISLGQTVYGGEVDVVNGSGNKITYGFVEYDGSEDENWTLSTSQAYIGNAYITINDAKFDGIIASNIAPSADNISDFVKGMVFLGGSTLNVWLFDTEITLNDFRNFLAEHPLQIRYELATPTTFTTQPTPIKSLNGSNNLSVDCGDVIEGEYFIALGGE